MEKYLYGVKYTIVKEDEYRYYIERTNTVVGLAKVFFTDTRTETATLQSDTYKGYKVEGISYRVRELYDYYKGYYGDGLNLSPEYQRDIVWGLEDKQNFIMSLFTNTYSGVITLVMNWKDPDYGYELLDGKQRLTTIFSFIEGDFPLANGLYFKDLCGDDQRFIIMYNLNCNRISSFKEVNLSLTEKVRLFLSLNSGVVVDKSHLEALRNKYIKEVK